MEQKNQEKVWIFNWVNKMSKQPAIYICSDRQVYELHRDSGSGEGDVSH